MKFRKSSFSQGAQGDCVEVAGEGGEVYVRDSKDPDGGTLRLSAETWHALLSDAKSGALDNLL